MTVGRISQAADEALLQNRPKARLTQHLAERLLQALPRDRLGQQGVEVLRNMAIGVCANNRRPVLVACVGG